MTDRFVLVEYDPKYDGTNWDECVGLLDLLPLDLIERVGLDQAFRETMNLDPCHMISCNMDRILDKDGKLYHHQAAHEDERR